MVRVKSYWVHESQEIWGVCVCVCVCVCVSVWCACMHVCACVCAICPCTYVSSDHSVVMFVYLNYGLFTDIAVCKFLLGVVVVWPETFLFCLYIFLYMCVCVCLYSFLQLFVQHIVP